jgi:hypothetical protein
VPKRRSRAPSASPVGELAAVAPAEFVRARNALAAGLRKAGREAAAREVMARPRPTLPIWTVNRLAGTQRENIDELIAAAERMKAAQLGRGARSRDLAGAVTGYRNVLRRLVERARVMLQEAGVRAPHGTLLRIETTLGAAASDPAHREALRGGRLEHELAPRGFEVFGGAMPSARPVAGGTGDAAGTASASAPKRPSRPEPAERERRAARLAAARDALARAQAEATAARERAASAERHVGELREAVREAMREAARLRRSASQAGKAQRAAEQDANAARRGVRP